MADHCDSIGLGSIGAGSIRHLFVYGTLRPGDVRWNFLEPFVVDDGWADTVPGCVFDTGLDFPAAIFDSTPRRDGGVIHGHTFALLEASLSRCLTVIDEVEQSVEGTYRRVAVRPASGVRAWAYEFGGGFALTPIPSGDWFVR